MARIQDVLTESRQLLIVDAARKATPFTVARTLTDMQTQEWLVHFQAHTEIRRYFGTIEIA